jgi:hypothetical protein
MVEISAQNVSDPTQVTSFGKVDGLNLAAAMPGPINLTVQVAPAISHVEIAKIDPTTPGSLTIKKKITKFDLNAIYINNTYTKLGLDGVTTTGSTVLNYGGNNTGSSSPWGDPANHYTPGFYDLYTGGATGQASYSPSAGKDCWGYYVPSLSAVGGTGTTINGELQGVLPHIILKVSNIWIEDYALPIEGTYYLTIRKYKTSSGAVTQFDPGCTYLISNIAFGLEHLDLLPEVTPADFSVELKIINWVDKVIEDDLL